MADTITFTSQSYHLSVSYDHASATSTLNFRNRAAFNISSSQQGAIWNLYRETSGTDDNPVILGFGGLERMHIQHVHETNETSLFLGNPAVRVFNLLPSQYGVLLEINRELDV